MPDLEMDDLKASFAYAARKLNHPILTANNMLNISAKVIKQTISILFGGIGISLITLSSVESAPVSCYSIIDLGSMGNNTGMPDDIKPTSINNLGQIVGYVTKYFDYRGTYQAHAFLWENGVMKDFGTLGGGQGLYVNRADTDLGGAYAYDINNVGQVIGSAATNEYTESYAEGYSPDSQDIFYSPVYHTFIWNKNKGIQNFSSSLATDINDAGQVIGDNFLWKNGVKTNLCPDSSCRFLDINNSGLIVGQGYQTIGQKFFRRAYLWKNGTLINLGTLGDSTDQSNWSIAYAINENGQIVGEANNKCALWDKNGSIFDLGKLSGDVCEAVDINNKGWVVANTYSGTSSRTLLHPYLWQRNRGWKDLNNLTPVNSGWVLSEVTSINDAGQIIGVGQLKGKQGRRGFLMIPRHF